MATKPRWIIQQLDRTQAVELFDCGQEALNRYISRFGLGAALLDNALSRTLQAAERMQTANPRKPGDQTGDKLS